jgi:hypothetical protein
MTGAGSTVVIEAPSREELFESFALRFKHLSPETVEQWFAELVRSGYADARREPDGRWQFVLTSK